MKEQMTIPEMKEIEAELNRLNDTKRYHSVLRSTVYTLVVVAAFAILAATLWLPFLRIYGTSMTPALQNGEIVVCVKTTDFAEGDIIAFYFNNKILVKRVIANAGEWVDIRKDGTVIVDGHRLDEPYVQDNAWGENDLIYPYQVPEGAYFVMGDHRSTSVDSRSSSVGCVQEDQIVGKVVLRLWPLKEVGRIK